MHKISLPCCKRMHTCVNHVIIHTCSHVVHVSCFCMSVNLESDELLLLDDYDDYDGDSDDVLLLIVTKVEDNSIMVLNCAIT